MELRLALAAAEVAQVNAEVAQVEAETARNASEAALKLRDEFLSVAAHELKTPMTSLFGAVQLLERQFAPHRELVAHDRARVARSLEMIHRQSAKAAQMTDALLDISRLHGGKLRLKPELTDVGALVRQVVAQAEAKIEGQAALFPCVTDQLPCPIRPMLPPQPVLVHVDPLRLEQVLTNLVDNAIRYSPNGGEIEVRLDQPGNGRAQSPASGTSGASALPRAQDRPRDPARSEDVLRLEVRDHGLGIPEEKRSGIFERYFQAHGDGHRSGLGLGLYISREIVTLHGGRIDVDFPADGGTRFVVALPCHCAHTLDAAAVGR
jgi:signal transduction histidine kinase